MKILFTFFIGFFLLLQSNDLDTLRNAYSTANKSNQNAEKFIDLAESSTSTDTNVLGYKAASYFLKSKLNLEKGKRIENLKIGGKQLESLISKNPNNAELRMIRLSLQENLPKIVGYYKNINEDKEFLLKNVSNQSSDIKKYIRNFIAQSKSFTAKEKTSFK